MKFLVVVAPPSIYHGHMGMSPNNNIMSKKDNTMAIYAVNRQLQVEIGQ